MADANEHVLQGFSFGNVVMHVVDGHERNCQTLGQCHAIVDVFLCNPAMDPSRVGEELFKHLEPRKTRHARFVHHLTAEG